MQESFYNKQRYGHICPNDTCLHDICPNTTIVLRHLSKHDICPNRTFVLTRHLSCQDICPNMTFCLRETKTRDYVVYILEC